MLKKEINIKKSVIFESMHNNIKYKPISIKCYICSQDVSKDDAMEIITKNAIYLVCDSCKTTHAKCVNILNKIQK